MNKHLRIFVALACFAGLVVSAGVTVYLNIRVDRNLFGEWLAPINVNIEIEKTFAGNVSIYSPSASWRPDNPMSARSAVFAAPEREVKNGNVELFAALDPNGFHRKIYLRVPSALAAQTVNAIDNVSVFIGNKLRYYSNADLRRFDVTEEGEDSLFLIPDLYYAKSIVVKDWANYYGDLNIALKLVLNFLLYPFRFAVSYIFLLIAAFLYRKEIKAACGRIAERPGFWTAAALTVVVLFAFAMRANGYVRHSGWSDEIYSAVRAGNPNFPLINTFTDPGNPPFYFMLLRYWFKIFGWSEESGTMLSVILGTAAVPVLYLLIKENYGAKTALLASFFMAVSGFAVAYSQEMRGYILKIVLAPAAALFFFRFLKKQSLPNLLPYVLLSVFIANTHYYGVLFVAANFLFYCIHEVTRKSFDRKKFFLFLSGNIIAGLSFAPFFLYQIIINKYDFERSYTPGIEHITLMLVILVLAVSVFIYRGKIIPKISGAAGIPFFLYSLFIPAAIFSLAFFISFVKPMVAFKYLFPVSFPFFLSSGAIMISMCGMKREIRFVSVFLVWAAALALYEGNAEIPDYAWYREARAFIAADAAAHPGIKSCMLNNAPENARYYGHEVLPNYSPDAGYDVLYVYNDIFAMTEDAMRESLRANNLDDKDMFVIVPCDDVVIFKKYLR